MRPRGYSLVTSPVAWGIVALAIVAAVGAVAWRVSSQRPIESSPVASRPTVPNASGLPRIGHVYLLILENNSPKQISDPASAPYYASLLRRYASTIDYHGVARPSQPNYLALFSGSTHGVDDDNPHDIDARTMADQLEDKGMTWHVYAENVPAGCFTGRTASGGRDGPGTYARKHEPAISFDSIREDPRRCANITDLSSLHYGAADFSLIVPNLCHDMHDCSVADGDRFLGDLVPRLIEDPAWAENDLLVITFDEGTGGDRANDLLTLFVGSRVRPEFTSSVRYDHYSLLRTLEDAWRLGCLAETCTAPAMTDLFKPN